VQCFGDGHWACKRVHVAVACVPSPAGLAAATLEDHVPEVGDLLALVLVDPSSDSRSHAAFLRPWPFRLRRAWRLAVKDSRAVSRACRSDNWCSSRLRARAERCTTLSWRWP